jgi:hypothetical protein
VANVTNTLDDLAADAGVPRFSLHDLRATGNTWLANGGVDVRIRQYLMSHKDGGPLITRYTKVTADTEKEIRDAVRVFDEIRTTKEKIRVRDPKIRVRGPGLQLSRFNYAEPRSAFWRTISLAILRSVERTFHSEEVWRTSAHTVFFWR